jgi:hypothetical protein
MKISSIDDFAEVTTTQPLKGLLVSQLEVWFPYSLEAVKLLREGLILAVRNTSSIHLSQISNLEEDQHYSLLRIDSIDTRHFVIDQIRQDRSDAPVSVEGLLEKHQHEWRRSTADPEENNLRIVASVSPTGLEIHLPLAVANLVGYDHAVRPDLGTMMLGEVAYLMNRDVVQLVVNRGMEAPSSKNSVMVAGTHTLYRSPALDVLLDTDALFRRHLGIFGFTGAGKSNLLSTLISSALGSGTDADRRGESNVLLFDVNNEYFGLLVDCLTMYDAHVVFVDDEISDIMASFLDGDYTLLKAAANDFLQTTTLSSKVDKLYRQEDSQLRAQILEITKNLLASGCFKRFEQSPEHLALFVLLQKVAQEGEALKKKLSGTGMKKKQSAFGTIVDVICSAFQDVNRNITIQDFEEILTMLNSAIKYCASDDEAEDNQVAMVMSEHVPKGDKDKLYSDLLGPLKKLHEFISSAQRDLESPLRVKGHSIDLSGIWGALHDDKRTLMIFLGSENSLREFSETLGSYIYNLRRRNGIVDPATIFIFDEADIFIPGQASNATDEEKDAIRSSKKIATTLARRGRKYGLGLGIATQRITYLDTSILAQIGSYFVGRLPRVSDRQKITEGFGIDKDSLQSGIRDVGDWVVLSHTAVGDRGAPLPVHFNNADERVVTFIKDFTIARYRDLSERRKKHDYLTDLAENQNNFINPVSTLDFLP